MKKFAFQFLFFLLPIFIFFYPADLFLSKELKKSHIKSDEFSVWNDIFAGKINSGIVIYGSSRAWVHIDPTMITDSLHIPAYNLGIDAHNFWLEYLRHSILLEHNAKPKLIIQTLDNSTLSKKETLSNLEQFLPYMLFNNEIKNATISYEGFSPIDYDFPLIRYYDRKLAIITAIKLFIWPKNNPVVRVKGYQGSKESWNSDFDNAKKEMPFYEVKLDTPSIHLFERYLNECKAKKIKIIFVYPPEYIEGQKFVKNRDEVMALYTNFSKKYDIPFYDYSNDSLSFHKKYFYNSEHLNKTGAELLTKDIIKKLKNISLVQ